MAVESSRQNQANRSSEEAKSSKEGGERSRLSRVMPVLPYVLGALVLAGYFVWMFTEMSSEAPGGGAVPLSIFGAVLLGVLAGGASILSSRRGRQK